MRRFLPASLRRGVVLLLFILLPIPSLAEVKGGTGGEADPIRTFRRWIGEMKEDARGPFHRIRWFCRDGTLQPPVPYACRERGGGVQHGEWDERTVALRTAGYRIANVLADIRPKEFLLDPDAQSALAQILLEQFLIEADDGWIFRRARYYRGALQAEDETAGGRALLLALIGDPVWRQRRFVTIREAVRFLPLGHTGAPLTEMRQLAKAIAEQDKGFEPLRIKLHVRPEPADADGVREYAGRLGQPRLTEDYRRLAKIIDEVYGARNPSAEVSRMAARVTSPDLRRKLEALAGRLADDNALAVRQAATSQLLALLRDHLDGSAPPDTMLSSLDLSLEVERAAYRLGNEFLKTLSERTRRERIAWLRRGCDDFYGMGLISARERQALLDSLAALTRSAPSLPAYRNELDYLSRLPQWCERTLRFHFGESIDRLAAIEPQVRDYYHDRLRGSPLLAWSEVLDSLVRDASRLLGRRHDLFGTPLATGLRPLNPGLARGTLKLVQPGEKLERADREDIYVLAETVTDLPPVAGIITAGAGNPLAHLQLLARNLGIPNLSVEHRLIPRLAGEEGNRVVLAVTPLGQIRIARDGPEWDAVFGGEESSGDFLIGAERGRLDLGTREVLSLSRLRAGDAGRVAGPKAANLGELKRHFPESVPDGLVIPFGVFAALLEESPGPGGLSLRQWLRREYQSLDRIREPAAREAAIRIILETMREGILGAALESDFTGQLRQAMDDTFGADGSYGVFVRSDTNVEDLPGFTGAGLNLTVPNVVGFNAVLEAIRRVWASAFSERAYGWRQAHMEHPEDVYPSVLLMKSVAAEKSGVLVTADVAGGGAGKITVAASEGVGGVVEGQRAEELLVDLASGDARLLARAAEPSKRILMPSGGVATVPASGSEELLSRNEIGRLIKLVQDLPRRYPLPADGGPVDIEFGFQDGRLVLFQIRPFVESAGARGSLYLNRLDRGITPKRTTKVDLDEVPMENGQ